MDEAGQLRTSPRAAGGYSVSVRAAPSKHHAFIACEEVGADYTSIRELLIQLLGSRGPGPAGHIKLSPGSQEALKSALYAALANKDFYVNTGHVLLGLANDKATDPPTSEPSLLRHKAHLKNPALYDRGQQALINTAGSLERVRAAVRNVDVTLLASDDTTPAGSHAIGLGAIWPCGATDVAGRFT